MHQHVPESLSDVGVGAEVCSLCCGASQGREGEGVGGDWMGWHHGGILGRVTCLGCAGRTHEVKEVGVEPSQASAARPVCPTAAIGVGMKAG